MPAAPGFVGIGAAPVTSQFVPLADDLPPEAPCERLRNCARRLSRRLVSIEVMVPVPELG